MASEGWELAVAWTAKGFVAVEEYRRLPELAKTLFLYRYNSKICTGIYKIDICGGEEALKGTQSKLIYVVLYELSWATLAYDLLLSAPHPDLAATPRKITATSPAAQAMHKASHPPCPV